MRVLVCGGRDYRNSSKVYEVLEGLHAEGMVLAEGGARGADQLARGWAALAGVSHLTYPADWNTHGPSAGPIRNKRMLKEFKPELVVAFPGGPGTAGMVRVARGAGVKVLEVVDGQGL